MLLSKNILKIFGKLKQIIMFVIKITLPTCLALIHYLS